MDGPLDKLRVRDKTFPKPIKTSDARQARLRFDLAEIEQWITAKKEQRDRQVEEPARRTPWIVPQARLGAGQTSHSNRVKTLNHIREALNQLDQKRSLSIGLGLRLFPVFQRVWASPYLPGEYWL